MSKQSKIVFTVGIVVVGAVLRIPFTTIPTVLTQVAEGLKVPTSSLGILTTIPLVLFALFSSLAPKIVKKTGIERLFALVLLIMTIGSLMRIFNVATLFIGTMLIGAAIAMLNVLLPSAIMANRPQKIGLYTTIYTTTMGIASGVAAIVAVPIVAATSWKGLIIVLSALVGVAFFVWLPNLKNNHQLVRQSTKDTPNPVWKNKAAWILLVFGGLQSLLFYTGMTWLPTMAHQSGLSQGIAGTLAGLYGLIGLPLAIILPSLLVKLAATGRRILMGFFSLCALVGTGLLLFPQTNFSYWLMVNLVLGLAVGAFFPYLMTMFSLKTTSASAAAELSGMVQTGGYLLASIGPVLFGVGFQAFDSFRPVVGALFVCIVILTIALYKIENYEKVM
jgi:CP family cyanate transporter-like MFS transporter